MIELDQTQEARIKDLIAKFCDSKGVTFGLDGFERAVREAVALGQSFERVEYRSSSEALMITDVSPSEMYDRPAIFKKDNGLMQ